MKCYGCGMDVVGATGGDMMDHYKACPQFAPDRVRVRRLERKLARARVARDKARADLRVLVRHGLDAQATYWHTRWMDCDSALRKMKTAPLPSGDEKERQ